MTITAILSALAQEQHGLIELLQRPRKVTHAGRDFWLGDLHGQPVVLALAKIGKVAAATAAAALMERFGAQRMVFIGVAGAPGADRQRRPFCLGRSRVQHPAQCFAVSRA